MRFSLSSLVVASILACLAVSSIPAWNPILISRVENPVRFYSITSLSDVPDNQPANTLVLFDLDDTVLDFPYMVGSQAWRRYIGKAAAKIDSSRNWHDIISAHLTKNYPVIAVESMTSEFIKNLQDKGFIVCGLTSRERNKWYKTPLDGVDVMSVAQLESIDINFNNGALENAYPSFAENPDYFGGTFFCTSESKGDLLKALLESSSNCPQKVLFFDDKESQVLSVAGALSELNIGGDCFHYKATEQKSANFKPLIANIQLYYFLLESKVLTDDEAAKIAASAPDKDETFYLKASLKLAKKL